MSEADTSGSKINPTLNPEDFDDPVTLNPVIGLRFADLLAAGRVVLRQALLQPNLVVEQMARYNQELLRILTGTSELDADPKDRRFIDKAFRENPIFGFSKKSWLAWRASLNEWVDGNEFEGVDRDRARFIVNLIADALAPTNFLFSNPSALRKARQTGGRSLVNGLRNFIGDMLNNHQMPSQVDKTAFTVGGNLANTPGSVVFRNDLIELIQYQPTTALVCARPVFIVPPQINKYYLYDLSPEKSMVRYLVGQGLQVFVISWRNPQAELRHMGLDAYVAAIEEALRATLEITGQEDVNAVGACAGGITLSLALGHFAARGWQPAHSLTLMVNVLRFGDADSVMSIFTTPATIDAARKRSARLGVLDGYDTAKVFNWMRPNDLIWNYVVSNYLHGEDPPTFDVLYWNNDCTRLPAQLHADFLDLFDGKSLARPGSVVVGGTPIDLKQTGFDVFITGGTTDHITPWKACYRSVPLFGGKVEFLLSSAGHIQSVLNPPGNPKAVYWTNDNTPGNPDEWKMGATQHNVSWWTCWSEWLRARGNGELPANTTPGSAVHAALCDAPGTYVFE
ncbi:MAG: alpha/beta fold hydrolase [Pseudomonadales bacterium]|nr:alpha/beta fold hydrolase [Pseudomonadales bacterium]